MAFAQPAVAARDAGLHPVRRRVQALLAEVDVVPGRGRPWDPVVRDARSTRSAIAC